MTEEPIEGKVARVLNSRELVINRGSEHGVVQGMTFEVLDAEGSDIHDPDTDEIIGSVYRPKVRVRVVLVEPKLALARTYRTRRVNRGGTGASFTGLTSLMGTPPRWVNEPETFKATDAAWEKITPDQSFVKVGDPVREFISTQRTVDEPPETEELEPAR